MVAFRWPGLSWTRKKTEAPKGHGGLVQSWSAYCLELTLLQMICVCFLDNWFLPFLVPGALLAEVSRNKPILSQVGEVHLRLPMAEVKWNQHSMQPSSSRRARQAQRGCRASFIFIISWSCTFSPGCVGMCITMETLEVKSLKCWQAEFLSGVWKNGEQAHRVTGRKDALRTTQMLSIPLGDFPFK